MPLFKKEKTTAAEVEVELKTDEIREPICWWVKRSVKGTVKSHKVFWKIPEGGFDGIELWQGRVTDGVWLRAEAEVTGDDDDELQRLSVKIETTGKLQIGKLAQRIELGSGKSITTRLSPKKHDEVLLLTLPLPIHVVHHPGTCRHGMVTITMEITYFAHDTLQRRIEISGKAARGRRRSRRPKSPVTSVYDDDAEYELPDLFEDLPEIGMCEDIVPLPPVPVLTSPDCISIVIESVALTVLPHVVLTNIMLFLPHADVLHVAVCCKDLHRVTSTDEIWKSVYWRYVREEHRLQCLPEEILSDGVCKAVDPFVVFPTGLKARTLTTVRKKVMKRESERRRFQREQKAAMIRRKLERIGPEIVAPGLVLFVVSCLIISVLIILDENYPTRTSTYSRLADCGALGMAIMLAYMTALACFSAPVNRADFFMILFEACGLAGTGFMMLRKGIENPSYSWKSTSDPLIAGLSLTGIVYMLDTCSYIAANRNHMIRARASTFISIICAPIPFTLTFFLASAYLDSGDYNCTKIFWPILLAVGALLPWPILITMYWIVWWLLRRRTKSFVRWFRKEFIPWFCAYLLYLAFCAFFFGMLEGFCYAPNLGMILLIVFLSMLTFLSFAFWGNAIREGSWW
eukprot:TRINITY_DN5397_c5_g1_i1.p1 TRINITY_DN5397_c5_g1~~TRINITY_DN5397_c5_g1_i1.p1  ORF type:complete len:649 (+),score=59.48 TRINITY_DN5397_c5_g1_i1:58-1947(+)